MNLEPLLSASPAIILHTFAALFAFALGIVQLAGPKGTTLHRLLGWTWALTMLTVAASSFWINGMKQFGDFSWIHGLSLLVLTMVPIALLAAKRHNVTKHRSIMISVFVGGLFVAGFFTLMPGRIMHDVVFPNDVQQAGQ
jgi:uncharacterized membrane protein